MTWRVGVAKIFALISRIRLVLKHKFFWIECTVTLTNTCVYVCVFLLQMNKTRIKWSKQFHCCEDRNSSLVYFFSLASSMGIIVSIFYGTVFIWGVRNEENGYAEIDDGAPATLAQAVVHPAPLAQAAVHPAPLVSITEDQPPSDNDLYQRANTSSSMFLWLISDLYIVIILFLFDSMQCAPSANIIEFLVCERNEYVRYNWEINIFFFTHRIYVKQRRPFHSDKRWIGWFTADVIWTHEQVVFVFVWFLF